MGHHTERQKSFANDQRTLCFLALTRSATSTGTQAERELIKPCRVSGISVR